MKKRIFNSIGSVFILMCVAVLGTMVTLWNFLHIYASSQPALWAAAVCAFSGAVICVGTKLIGRAGIFVKIVLFCLIAAFSIIKFDIVIGGFGYIFNFFIEAVNDYYNSGIYYISLTDGMLSEGSQSLFIMLACTLTGWWYMSALLNRKGTFFAALAAFLSYLLPASLENTPSVYILFGMLVFVVCVIIHGILPSEKNELRARMSGILAMLWVILPSMLIVFAAVRLVPEKDLKMPEFYDKIAGRIIFSVRDLQDIFELYNGKNSTQTNDGGIGRVDSVEYDDVPIMSVTAPKNGGTIYLKTFQAANYTKRRWRALDESVYKRYSGLFDELESTGNTPLLMEYRAISELTGMGAVGIGSAAFDIDITQYESDGRSYIPVSAILIDGESIDNFSYGDKNIVLDEDTAGNVNVSHSYSLYEWRDMSRLDKLAVDGEVLAYDDGNSYRDFVYDNYMDKDTSCDDRIQKELLGEIMDGDYDTLDAQGRARFIMDTIAFFADEYEYTLSPGVTPAAKDYVEYFLFEQKKGLCTHFASAAVMIFRSVGIPARYVEGFVIPQSLYTGYPVLEKEAVVRQNGGLRKEMWEYYAIELTDRYAHAWAEVYIDGIGWVTVDPTPGYAEAYLKSQEWKDNVSDGTSGADDSLTTTEQTQPEETEPEGEEDSENSNSGEDMTSSDGNGSIEKESSLPAVTEPSAGDGPVGGNDISDTVSGQIDEAKTAVDALVFFMPVLKVLLFILEIIAVPVVIVLFFVKRQKYMEQSRTKLYNSACGLDTDERIRRIMAYFEKLLRQSEINVDSSMDFMQLINGMPVEGIESSSVAGIVEMALFSGNLPGEDDTMLVMAYVMAVRMKIYSKKNIFGKFYFKYILAL